MPTISIAIGSNDQQQQNIAQALEQLRAFLTAIELSPTYESAPVGFSGQAFWNLVLIAHTELDRPSLIKQLKAIEDAQGRIRDRCHPVKSLDLDLLIYDFEQEMSPHADILSYSYVLKPLQDLRPKWLHPQSNVTLELLWVNFSGINVKLSVKNVNWFAYCLLNTDQ